MFVDILLKLPVIGRYVEKKIVRNQGGELVSEYLRNKIKKENNVTVGLYSYGGCFANDFNVGGKVSIGRYCSIAKDVHYFGANHPINYVSSSAIFYNKKMGFNVNDIERYSLEIGNDVWIGFGTIILCGCKHIGDGAVIGAGSVVTKDVEPYSIVAGNPAKVIRMRFDERTIKRIAESDLYKKDPEVLMKYYKYIDSPIEFIEALGEIND